MRWRSATSIGGRTLREREHGGLPFEAAAVTARCAFCSFTVTALVEEAHAAFEAHVCDRPKPVVSKGRRSGFALR